MSTTRTVVIVEDDFLIAEYLRTICTDLGTEVIGMASESDAAQKLIEEQGPEYVLMDVRLSGRRDGVDIALHVHESNPETKIIFITGSNEPPTLSRINMDHPHKILIKPINPGDLAAALRE